MSDSSTNPPSPSRRRSSLTPGEPALSSVFGRSNSQAAMTSMPGNVSANRRRMSISTLGLSGSSPTNASPWSAAASATAMGRRGSMSSAGTSIDENAVEDGDATSVPSTPFARRLSFGPRALRDTRATNTSSGSPTSKGRDPGFNWTESLRSKAETQAERNNAKLAEDRAAQRAASIAAMPSQESKADRRPDAFQERLLKGEFMMD